MRRMAALLAPPHQTGTSCCGAGERITSGNESTCPRTRSGSPVQSLRTPTPSTRSAERVQVPSLRGRNASSMRPPSPRHRGVDSAAVRGALRSDGSRGRLSRVETRRCERSRLPSRRNPRVLAARRIAIRVGRASPCLAVNTSRLRVSRMMERARHACDPSIRSRSTPWSAPCAAVRQPAATAAAIKPSRARGSLRKPRHQSTRGLLILGVRWVLPKRDLLREAGRALKEQAQRCAPTIVQFSHPAPAATENT